MALWLSPCSRTSAVSTPRHIPFTILQSLFSNLYNKIPKIFILLSLSDLAFASGCEGIDNPFIALVVRFLIVCVGTRWLVCRLQLDWYLGSQNWGKYLRYFAASPFPLHGKTNVCSRGSIGPSNCVVFCIVCSIFCERAGSIFVYLLKLHNSWHCIENLVLFVLYKCKMTKFIRAKFIFII